jgi:hypothetical protein
MIALCIDQRQSAVSGDAARSPPRRKRALAADDGGVEAHPKACAMVSWHASASASGSISIMRAVRIRPWIYKISAADLGRLK